MNKDIFTQQELDLLDNINAIALRNAMNAFSSMLKDEIIVKYPQSNPTNTDILKQLSTENDYISTIYTKIVGDLNIDTYLLVNEAAEAAICKSLLPTNIMGQEEMREGLLMEVDNIIIASLVTKYANLFDINIHGQVPGLQKTNPSNFLDQLTRRNAEHNIIYGYKTDLSAFKAKFTMGLLCFFKPQLLEITRNFNYNNAYVGDKSKDERKHKNKFFFTRLFS